MNQYLPDGYRWATPVERVLIKKSKTKPVRSVNIIVDRKGTKRMAVPR